MIEASSRFASSEIPPNHLGKYLSWLHLQKTRAERGEYELVPDAEVYVRLDSTSRLSLVETTRQDIATTNAGSLGTCIFRVFQYFEDVYYGRIDPLEILLHDGALTNLYDYFTVDYTVFLNLLSHNKPNLQILKIGTGTGGTTSIVLDYLTSVFSERMYSEYHFTDISAGFFISAKDRFKHTSNIKYNVLNISRDRLIQGFEERSFNLIIAANVDFLHRYNSELQWTNGILQVLHTTPLINTTLKNIAKLLRQDGKLLVQELYPCMSLSHTKISALTEPTAARFINYIIVRIDPRFQLRVLIILSA